MAILSIRGRRQGVWTSSEVTGRSRRVRRKKWLPVELLERRRLLSAIHLSYDAPAIYKVDNCPSSLTIGDFNGDGRNDLAVVNAGLYPNYNGTVSILLGNADGTVPAKVDYPAGYRPFAVAVGDFNGDGHGDLVVSNSDGTTGILLGKGDGTFQAMVSYAVGGEVAVGDFNGDGRSDLALTNRNNNTVGILLASGDGTFKPIVNYAVGTTPAAAAVGDFDNNGKSDLAVANEGDNTVSILRGNGDGTFQSRVDYAWGGTGQFNLFSVVAGDFNGDGHSDLAVSSESCSAPYSGEVDILQGAGDGTFHTATTIDGVDGYLTVGDFNKDGRSDLAVASFGAAVDILLAKIDGTFQPTTSYSIGLWPSFRGGG